MKRLTLSTLFILTFVTIYSQQTSPNTATPFHDKDIATEEQKEVKTEPFIFVEKMPQFPGGQQKMYEFLVQNLKYPEQARKDTISGQVITQFTVTETGMIEDIKVMRGIGGGCNEAAIAVLELMNVAHRWTPGYYDGQAVPVRFTLPIKFTFAAADK